MAEASACRACGAPGIEPHWHVAGDAGPDGLVPTTDRFGTALADVGRCPACGHMQLLRMPAEALLERAYAEAESADYVEEEEGQRQTARQILAEVERHREPGAMLDLGCWVGFFLSEAERRGWSGTGIEPSEFASDFARTRLGLDVRTAGLFDADLPGHRFDAVFLGDVIEHLPEPGNALERISKLLAPGGVLALALPDAGSLVARAMGRRWWSVIPTHVHYFTRRSIRTLLMREGFEVLAMTTAPKAFTVGYYLERIGGYSSGLSRALEGVAARLGLARRTWAPDFRDRMMVIAQRVEQ